METLTPPIDKIEELRIILSKDLQRYVDYTEAEDIGQTLIEFYEALAGVS
jgi:hypothetical protein